MCGAKICTLWGPFCMSFLLCKHIMNIILLNMLSSWHNFTLKIQYFYRFVVCFYRLRLMCCFGADIPKTCVHVSIASERVCLWAPTVSLGLSRTTACLSAPHQPPAPEHEPSCFWSEWLLFQFQCYSPGIKPAHTSYPRGQWAPLCRSTHTHTLDLQKYV